MTNKNSEKLAQFYICEICTYKTVRKNDFDKHLLTAKHLRLKLAENCEKLLTEKNQHDYSCECGKKYKHLSSLYKHKKICKFIENDNNMINNVNFNSNDFKMVLDVFKEMILYNNEKQFEQQNKLIEKQAEKQIEQHQKMLTEIIPKIGNNTTNNNQFNINMFLNEKCKDAINIKEFIDMIVFNKETMDDSKNLGIEKTMTNLIIDKLNSLDIHKRPIHCSDIRRETIYVKDNGEWTKTNTKTILKKMIRSIQDKGCTTLSEWRKQNPDDPKGNPDLLDPNALYYHKVIKQVCLETEKYDDKVIRNICKSTYVK